MYFCFYVSQYFKFVYLFFRNNDGKGKEDFPELYGLNGSSESVADSTNYYGYSNFSGYSGYTGQSASSNLQISTVHYYQQQQQQQQQHQAHSYQISSYNSTLNSMANSPQQQQRSVNSQQPSAIINGYQPEPAQQIHAVYENNDNNNQPQPVSHYTEIKNETKIKSEQPIVKRRNSGSERKRKAPISTLNLSEISNKKNSLSPVNSNSNLPPPRRSPRIAKLANLAMSAPKTKDVINDLANLVDNQGSAFNFSSNNNNGLLSARLSTQTPRIEKELKEFRKIEQSLRTDTDQTGLTPFLQEGPMTRSARRRKEEKIIFDFEKI